MRKSLWVDLICGLLILLFLYTAFSKLFHYRQFRATLQASPLVGSLSGTVAWALPVAEILLSLLLFVPITKRAGMYGSLFMLSFFTIYLMYILLFAHHLPCNCGGVIERMSWKQHILFNFFFIGLTLLGLSVEQKQKKEWEKSLPYPTLEDVL